MLMLAYGGPVLGCLRRRDRAQSARMGLAIKGGRSTSTYRGVTHHIRTGRWEAHIWECGKQVGAVRMAAAA